MRANEQQIYNFIEFPQSLSEVEKVVFNLVFQLDYNWNQLKPKHMGIPHRTFLIGLKQEDPPQVWTKPANDKPYNRTWKKEAFAFLSAFPYYHWQVHRSHSRSIPLLWLEPTSSGFKIRLCGVSLFSWLLATKYKGSRGSGQGLAGCEYDKTFWESAPVRQLNVIPKWGNTGWGQQLEHHLKGLIVCCIFNLAAQFHHTDGSTTPTYLPFG